MLLLHCCYLSNCRATFVDFLFDGIRVAWLVIIGCILFRPQYPMSHTFMIGTCLCPVCADTTCGVMELLIIRDRPRTGGPISLRHLLMPLYAGRKGFAHHLSGLLAHFITIRSLTNKSAIFILLHDPAQHACQLKLCVTYTVEVSVICNVAASMICGVNLYTGKVVAQMTWPQNRAQSPQIRNLWGQVSCEDCRALLGK